LFGWHFQPLTPPDPLDPFLVHRPAACAKQRRDPAIPVAAVLPGKFNDIGRQSSFIIGRPGDLPLRRSMLTQCPASSSLGDAKLGCHMTYARAAARRA